jgi:hypothetical protein
MKVYIVGLWVFTGVSVAALLTFVIVTTVLGGSIPFSAVTSASAVAACCWRATRNGSGDTSRRVEPKSDKPVKRRRSAVRCVVFTDELASSVEVLRNA